MKSPQKFKKDLEISKYSHKSRKSFEMKYAKKISKLFNINLGDIKIILAHSPVDIDIVDFLKKSKVLEYMNEFNLYYKDLLENTLKNDNQIVSNEDKDDSYPELSLQAYNPNSSLRLEDIIKLNNDKVLAVKFSLAEYRYSDRIVDPELIDCLDTTYIHNN